MLPRQQKRNHTEVVSPSSSDSEQSQRKRVVIDKYSRKEPLSERSVFNMSADSSSGGRDGSKQELRKRIKKIFNQLVYGCGNPVCPNSHCASSSNFEHSALTSRTAAVATALSLAVDVSTEECPTFSPTILKCDAFLVFLNWIHDRDICVEIVDLLLRSLFAFPSTLVQFFTFTSHDMDTVENCAGYPGHSRREVELPISIPVDLESASKIFAELDAIRFSDKGIQLRSSYLHTFDSLMLLMGNIATGRPLTLDSLPSENVAFLAFTLISELFILPSCPAISIAEISRNDNDLVLLEDFARVFGMLRNSDISTYGTWVSSERVFPVDIMDLVVQFVHGAISKRLATFQIPPNPAKDWFTRVFTRFLSVFAEHNLPQMPPFPVHLNDEEGDDGKNEEREGSSDIATKLVSEKGGRRDVLHPICGRLPRDSFYDESVCELIVLEEDMEKYYHHVERRQIRIGDRRSQLRGSSHGGSPNRQDSERSPNDLLSSLASVFSPRSTFSPGQPRGSFLNSSYSSYGARGITPGIPVARTKCLVYPKQFVRGHSNTGDSSSTSHAPTSSKMALDDDVGSSSTRRERSSSGSLRTRRNQLIIPHREQQQSQITSMDLDEMIGNLESKRENETEDPNFTFLSNSFILNPVVKSHVLQRHAQIEMEKSRVRSLLESVSFGQVQMSMENLFFILRVHRDSVIRDSLVQFDHVPTNYLKRELRVVFVGEEGVDEGGVKKEFFQLVTRDIFDPKYGMFTFDDEARTVWFSPISTDIAEFHLIGVIMGVAIFNSVILDLKFPPVVYRKLLGGTPSLQDLEDVRPSLTSGLRKILAMSEEELEAVDQYFEYTVESYGSYNTVELVEGGSEERVTIENREKYVETLVSYILESSIEKQFKAFKKGFMKVVGGWAFDLFVWEELELLVCGSPTLDFLELERHARYDNGYSANHEAIRRFWKIVHGFSEEQKKKLLFFTTGSDRTPIGGLKDLDFIISRSPVSEQLPSSHTCMGVLVLPEYGDEAEMKQKLLTAIMNSEGFGLL